MKIIIAGAGEVGFHLAKLLSYESQDITLIDNNRDNLMYMQILIWILEPLKGDATSISILKGGECKACGFVNWCNLQRVYKYYRLCSCKAIGS
jgi:trk system potassium uptake protein